MGFDGLIVTDAMDMEGVGSAWIGEATVEAVRAGADVILMPPDLRVALQSLIRAVEERELAEERLDQSVKRILSAKARLDLNNDRLVDLNAGALEVGRPEDVERAVEIAEASITVVRNEGGVLPLAAEKPLRVLQIVIPDDVGVPWAEFRRRRVEVSTTALGQEISREKADEILGEVGNFTHVLISTSYYREKISDSLVQLLGRLAEKDVPVIVVSFGDPYLLRDLPEGVTYVCAYGSSESSRQAAASALFGEIDVRGRLPVTLSEEFAVGYGIEIPAARDDPGRRNPRGGGLSPRGTGRSRPGPR